ncbi:MAG: carbamoyltransferase family protein [Bacteroidota bacterium]
MKILGISSYYHDSSACIISDGKLVAAVQEERFDRIKNSSELPVQSINFCVQKANIGFSDIDLVAYYEKPYSKFQRIIQDYIEKFPRSYGSFLRNMPFWLQDRLILPLVLKKEFAYEGETVFIPHHYSHAASSFFLSPFSKAGIITADGVGELESTCYGEGDGNKIKFHKQINYPNSLGLLYTAITTFLGFKANSGEGTCMALASFGKPDYIKEFEELIHIAEDGSYMLNKRYFPMNIGKKMYSRHLVKLLGKNRDPDAKINDRHKAIAATLQYVVEDVLIKIARHTVQQTGNHNLCFSGGVFLNCVANQKILDLPEVENVFIQPAAGDAGGAIGAAYYAWHQIYDKPRKYEMKHACLGPEFSSKNIQAALAKKHLNAKACSERELLDIVTEKIISGKTVGWMQEKLEFGPRALGSRSILADARNPEMVNILNKKIKHREWFRPFAPVVKEEKANEYFKLKNMSPFMLLAPEVHPGKKDIIPAVTHVDNTARVQTVNKNINPLLWKLLDAMEAKTGVPVIINTSFNLKGEPIVCKPEEAIADFLKTEMDALVMGKYFVEK